MQSYIVDIIPAKVIRDAYGVAFEYYRYDPKTQRNFFKAENIDKLRARLATKEMKITTGKCYVAKASANGKPSVWLGALFNYGQGEYFWEVNDSGLLTRFDLKTGKLRRN